jgi:hypothetical protein
LELIIFYSSWFGTWCLFFCNLFGFWFGAALGTPQRFFDAIAFHNRHPPSPLQPPLLEVHLPLLRCNGLTQGQKSLALWLHRRITPTPHHKMSSSNPGRNPKAPPFSPNDPVDLEDELQQPLCTRHENFYSLSESIRETL